MNKLEFITLCGEFLIAPSVALENQALVDALAARDDKRVREIFEKEF